MTKAPIHRCLSCKFARWETTLSGRLHPSGDGRCQWKMPPVVLPAAFYWLGFRQDNQPQPSGGHINRRDPRPECPTWEKTP
jgi:hypothetical protein